MKPHGIYTIESSGRILFVDATGPFNDEVIRRYLKELMAEIEALAPDPWAMFVIFRNVSLFTPEAERELTAVNKLRKDLGMEFIALVFLDIVGAEILRSQIDRIYESAGVEHAYFDSSAKAREWLAEKGYQVGKVSRQFTV